MFKSGHRDRDEGIPLAPAHPEPQPHAGGSVLGADVVVTGNIAATADLRIDGRIEGDVACGALVQGAESVVVGSVSAESARIAGSIEGAVRVRDLQIERSARIAGDVEYEAITIANGARVDGNLRHKSKGTLGAGNVTPIARAAEAPKGDAPADGSQRQLLA